MLAYHLSYYRERYVRDFWHFKSKPVSDLLTLEREIFPIPTKACSLVLFTGQEGKKLMGCELDLVCAFGLFDLHTDSKHLF